MSDARDAIFEKLPHNIAATEQAVTHLTRHPRGPQPHWTLENLQRFTEKLGAVAGSYSIVTGTSDLPDAISRYLDDRQLAHRLTLAPHPLLEAVSWPADFNVSFGKATAEAQVTVNVASCGIAETGSLVLPATPQSPTSLNFLADHFLCVLHSSDIVPHMEDAWDRWRAQSSRVPRVINFITGPSRTADVEQIIQLGAHGPRQLHVLLLDAD